MCSRLHPPSTRCSTSLTRSLTVWASLLLAMCINHQVAFAQAGNAVAVGVAAQDMTQAAAGNQPAATPAAQTSDEATPPPAVSPDGTPMNQSPTTPAEMRASGAGAYGSSPTSSDGSYSSSPDGSDSNPDGSYGTAPAGPGWGASLQMMSSMVSAQIAAAAAEMFAGSNEPQEIDVAKLTLWDQAALAFYSGDQNRSLSLLYAHVIADGAAADPVRQRIAFSRDLRRPVWQVRFGISTHLRLPDGFGSDPEPIREGMQLTGVAGRRTGAGGGYPGGAAPPMRNRDEAMMAENRGIADANPAAGVNGADFANPGSTTQAAVMAFGGATSQEAQQTIDANLGFVATVFRELFDQRQASGKFGQAFEGMKAAAEKMLQQSSGYSEPTLSALPMWTPGIDYVGDGPYATMLAQAKANRLDYLLHFEIAVKENRLGSPAYLTRCKLMNVETGETLGLSKAIDKYEVVDARGGMRAAIEAQLANLFEIIDKRITVVPMPELQPQQAVTRIDSLLATNRFGMLRNLAEINLFHSRKLLTDQQLNQCVYFLTGDKGLQAMHDIETLRYEAVLELVEADLQPPKN